MLTIHHPAPGKWIAVDEKGVVRSFDCWMEREVYDPKTETFTTIVDGKPTTVTQFPTLDSLHRSIRRTAINPWYLGLLAWLKEIRVCRSCAVQMAMAKVEHMERRKYDWKAHRGKCMGAACRMCWWCQQGMHCGQPLDCEFVAKRHASEAPAFVDPIKPIDTLKRIFTTTPEQSVASTPDSDPVVLVVDEPEAGVDG